MANGKKHIFGSCVISQFRRNWRIGYFEIPPKLVVMLVIRWRKWYNMNHETKNIPENAGLEVRI
jgi:hypothetical protein